MLSFTKNRDQPQNRQVCLTTPMTICPSRMNSIKWIAKCYFIK
jgi:hypothetical protein